MALQIWLPLDGDTRNQGLYPATITNQNATLDANGKIGKCYSFSSASTYLQASYCIPKFDSTNRYTLACWIYPTNSGSQNGFLGTTAYTWSFYYDQSKIGFVHWISGGSTRVIDLLSTSTITANTWTHVCVTWDGTKMTLYLNGIKDKEVERVNGASQSTTQNVNIGGNIYTWQSQIYQGKLNDVRIYDNCLSPKEVKEISQGLLVHYLLDGQSLNYIHTYPEKIALPSDYQQIEFIESTGTQYIDTGIKYAYKQDSSELKLMLTDPTQSQTGVCGSRDTVGSSSNHDTCTIFYNMQQDTFRLDQISNGTGYYAIPILDTFIMINKYNKCIVNETVYTGSGTTNDITSNYNWLLFTFNNAGSGPYQAKTKMRVYYCKLYHQNTCVANLIPCYNKTSGNIGLYDIIRNVFLTNAGTGTFIKGPDIKDLPAGYTFINGCKSNGTNTVALDLQSMAAGTNDWGSTRYYAKYYIPITASTRMLIGADGGCYFGIRGKKYELGNKLGSETLTESKIHNFGFTCKSGTGKLYVDGTSKVSNDRSYSANSIGAFGAGGPNGTYALTCYFFEICSANVVVGSLYPVIRTSDGAVGLYDMVRDRFFTHETLSINTNNNTHVIYDTSGYLHNATMMDKTLAIDSNTPRYNNCFYFKNSPLASQITAKLPIWSMSCWYKPRTNISSYQAVAALTRTDGNDANKKICFCMTNNTSIWIKCESSGLTVPGVSSPKDEWHHVCMTSNGTNYFIYQDGIQKSTGSCGTVLLDCFNLVIGARSANAENTSYSVPWNGNLVDFRLYSTTLSATDVKELYETSMVVDSSGNILPRVLTS